MCPNSTDSFQSSGQHVSGVAWETLKVSWQRLLMGDSHHLLWGREQGSEGEWE